MKSKASLYPAEVQETMTAEVEEGGVKNFVTRRTMQLHLLRNRLMWAWSVDTKRKRVVALVMVEQIAIWSIVKSCTEFHYYASDYEEGEEFNLVYLWPLLPPHLHAAGRIPGEHRMTASTAHRITRHTITGSSTCTDRREIVKSGRTYTIKY
jgi:hypothetical protein